MERKWPLLRLKEKSLEHSGKDGRKIKAKFPHLAKFLVKINRKRRRRLKNGSNRVERLNIWYVPPYCL